jgi:peptidoglycan biosynthesis protein MviN/MurJ (putative lipid II flippase)
MLWLLRRHVSLDGLRLREALLKAVLASILMALVVYALATWVLPLLVPADSAFVGPLVTVVAAAGVGGGFYIGLSMVLRVEALGFFAAALRRRLGRA